MTIAAEPRLTNAEWWAKMAEMEDERHHLAPGWPVCDQLLTYKRLENRSERTIDSMERTYRDLLMMIPKPFEEYTYVDLTAFLGRPVGRSGRPLSPATRRREWSHLSELFRFATAWELIEKNPMTKVPRPSLGRQKIIDIFSDVDEAALVTTGPIEDRGLHALLFGAGLRKSEAINLQRRDVNLEARTVTVIAGKGNKGRVISISPETANIVADMIVLEGIDDDDYLWYSERANACSKVRRRNKPCGSGTFHRWWGRTLGAAGVEYKNPHTARHTYATRYLRKNPNELAQLARLLGHANVDITARLYVHLEVSDLVPGVERAFIDRYTV